MLAKRRAKRAKQSALEAVSTALADETLLKHRETLDLKKQEMAKSLAELKQAAEETQAVTALLVNKLTSKFKVTIDNIFSTHKNEGIAFVDYKGSILYANEICAHVIGIDRSELLGKSVTLGELDISSYAKQLFEDQIEVCGLLTDVETDIGNVSITVGSHTTAINLRATLLDLAPKKLSGVVFVCYISYVKV